MLKLSIISVFLLLFYHLNSFFTDREKPAVFKWNRAWKKISFIIASNEVFSVSVPEKPVRSAFNQIDPTSIKLTEIGHALNFLWGRFPDFLYVGKRLKYQHIFTRTEIATLHPKYAQTLPSYLKEEARQFYSSLKKNGILMVPVIIPSHLSINRKTASDMLESDQLFEKTNYLFGTTEEAASSVYDQVLMALSQQPLNLYTEFAEHTEKHPEDNLYLPYDMHWTSLGIALTAEKIIGKLKETNSKINLVEKTLVGSALPDLDVNSLKALQLPYWFQKSFSSLNYYEPIFELTKAGKNLPQGRLIVAGSCQSMRFQHPSFTSEPYSLGALLARSLNREYLDVSMDNGSPLAPLKILQDEKWILQKGDILIWEFPIQARFQENEHFPTLYTTIQ